MSGDIEIGCGLGKTAVGAELIRRTRAPAVVVTQNAISVAQWVRHLREHAGLGVVLDAEGARRHGWSVADPLPDAAVFTYHGLVRAARLAAEHAAPLAAGAHAAGGEVAEDRNVQLALLLHVARFGALVLDEVHVAVADHFVGVARCARASSTA